jgi:hypothetical protein
MRTNIASRQGSYHRETKATHVAEKDQCSVDPLGAMFLFTHDTHKCSVSWLSAPNLLKEINRYCILFSLSYMRKQGIFVSHRGPEYGRVHCIATPNMTKA